VSPAETFVVVGASLAGATAAATLREEGFDGRLVLIGEEPLPPYERPPLSKGFLRGEEPIESAFVRTPDWWEAHGVEARFGERAERLDPRQRTVTLASGQQVTYDAALVATGARNRRLDVPGADLEGVFDLRTAADAERIRAAVAGGARILLIGFGFIGAEVAASLRSLGHEVTVVEIFETALYRVLGAELGRVFEAIHRDRGVTVHYGDTVERLEGAGRVEVARTRSGRRIACDVVVIGVGTEPNADVMRGEGLAANGGVKVGPTLETRFPRVFAAGDVATHDHPRFGPIRVEHYDNAVKMAVAAAKNMLGAGVVFDDPHWFWSDQYDHQLQMGGFAPRWDRMVVRGSLDERSFSAFLLQDGVLQGSVSLDRPRDVRRSLPLIAAGLRPDPDALADPDVDLRTLAEGT
jgi:3-phenylpropionate/trans-cinnamate dioxygenase ferredoxin reductase subunit